LNLQEEYDLSTKNATADLSPMHPFFRGYTIHIIKSKREDENEKGKGRRAKVGKDWQGMHTHTWCNILLYQLLQH